MQSDLATSLTHSRQRGPIGQKPGRDDVEEANLGYTAASLKMGLRSSLFDPKMPASEIGRYGLSWHTRDLQSYFELFGVLAEGRGSAFEISV